MTSPASDQAALGALPEWNLADLYPGMDSAEYARDLARAATDCAAFAEKWRGKLVHAAEAADASAQLFQAVQDYEAIEDRLGRIMSYAGLIYSGDTTDPTRAKFYGDAQEQITNASSDLLFFTLELNRIDDALLEKALNTAPLSPITVAAEV